MIPHITSLLENFWQDDSDDSEEDVDDELSSSTRMQIQDEINVHSMLGLDPNASTEDWQSAYRCAIGSSIRECGVNTMVSRKHSFWVESELMHEKFAVDLG
jgi:hypothetical protein